MAQRNRLSAAILAGMTAAVLTLVLPVEAQVPATAPVVKPADTVNLTMEQRHVIKEIIIKDMKIAEPPDQAAKVPQLKAHSFLVKSDQVVINDPKDNKVAALVE